MIKQRSKLQIKFYRKALTLGEVYHSLRNRISHTIRLAKVKHLKSKLTEYSSNNRKTWSVIKAILRRKDKESLYADTHIITLDHFNNHLAITGSHRA